MSNKNRMDYNEIVKKSNEVFDGLSVDYYVFQECSHFNSQKDFKYTLCFGDPNREVFSVIRYVKDDGKIYEDIEFWNFEQHFHITEFGFKKLKDCINLYINHSVDIIFFVDSIQRYGFQTIKVGNFKLKKLILDVLKIEFNRFSSSNENNLLFLLEKYGQIDIEVKLGIFGSTKKFTYTKESGVTKVV